MLSACLRLFYFFPLCAPLRSLRLCGESSTTASFMSIASVPVAILAGGLATRLRPITEKIPKSLVTVAGEAFLAHQLRLLHSRGVRTAVLCVGYLGEMIEKE